MDEQATRQWVRDILKVIRQGCLLTDTVIDENVVDAVLRAVDSDLLWGWIMKLIGRFLNDDEPILVEADTELMAACEAEMINPMLVIAVIQALVALWKAFRK